MIVFFAKNGFFLRNNYNLYQKDLIFRPKVSLLTVIFAVFSL